MRLADAVVLGIDAARSVVHGEPYAPELTDAVYRVFGADAGAGVTQWRVHEGRAVALSSLVLSLDEAPRLTADQVAAAEAAASHHPSFAMMLAGRTGLRLSDAVDLERFWDTEVYQAMHGHCEGRYPSAVLLHRSPTSLLFLGVHRQVRDLDDDELACLVALAEPLSAALGFRAALERATARLGEVPGSGGPFSPREAEVIVLVSRGWTTERIARRLGVSPTAVKNRLASARDRVGAASRAELVARWARERAT